MKTALTPCLSREALLFLVLVISIFARSFQITASPDNVIYIDNINKITQLKNQLTNLQNTKYRVKRFFNQERLNLPLSPKSKRTHVDPEQFRSEVSHHQLPLTLVKKQVRDYYKCLNESHTAKRNIYRALVVKVGQTLVLKCHQCFQPGTPDQKRKEVMWKVFRQDGAIMSNIQPDKSYKLTPKRDLQIKAISLEDTGQYFCLRNNSYKAVYQVDVHRQLNYHIVEENSTKLANEPIPENNLELVSNWSPWTECSQCGTKGIRTRTGICTIKKIFKDKPIKPVDIPAFYMFDGGLPCRSSVVPQRIAQLTPIAKRKSEILISACAPPCPTTPHQTLIKDSQGNIIDVIQPGYYSMQDKPELSPVIKRSVIYMFEGKQAILKCPTLERMIRWQNGTEALNFMTLRKKSKGRTFIDGNNWLHIKRTKLSDSAIYSCWKQDKLLSTIKLKVTKGYRKDVGPYITYSLAVMILVCLLLAMYNIYSGPQNRVAY